MDETPSREDLAAAGRARTKVAGTLDREVKRSTALAVAALRGGMRPTEVATLLQWTAAHVRKIARDNGIEPDPRYAERAENLRRKS